MDNTMRRSAGIVGQVAAVTVAVVLVTSMATGWLYWIRAAVAPWPGPRLQDALPLDELPGHDGVPLAVYFAVFAVAAVLLGLVARLARLGRMAAGLSLAIGTWLWLLVTDAFSLYLVRQVPLGQAVHSALALRPIYLAAALAGAGGALLGRGTRSRAITPRLLAWLVALSGLVDLASALVPHSSLTAGIPGWLSHGAASPAAQVLLVPVGVMLLITSRGLVRRSRRAWELALALLSWSVLLQLLRWPGDAAAIMIGLLVIVLAARRQAFPFQGDPAARPSASRRLLGTLLFALGYGTAAFWVYRSAAGQPFRLLPALLDTLRAMAGQLPRDIAFLPGEFADWFPISILSIVMIGGIWAATVWIRPWQQRIFPDLRRRDQAARIVRQWGTDTLAPFALRSDKEWFVTGQTLIAYRVIRGIALVSGDPVGPPEDHDRALDCFLAFARARGWRTAVMGASGQLATLCRARGLRAFYHGDEAVIDTSAFSLDGRPMRPVRQAVHRLERGQFSAEVVMAGRVSPALRGELAAVERAWLRGRPRTGFTMELDSLFRLGADDAAFVIGRDGQGNVNGFLHLVICRPSRSLSLSTMPRQQQTPNGFTSWLIVEAVTWARSQGFDHLSLNFSPFARLLGSQAGLAPAQRLQRRALLRVKGLLALQLDNLLRFNDQFAPSRLPRYLVLEAWSDLPRVAVAAMAAEGYLPLARLVRGRAWPPPQPIRRRVPSAAAPSLQQR
jgi:lysyl-tRNA synthetase, class II